jgi:hypothetical protein
MKRRRKIVNDAEGGEEGEMGAEMEAEGRRARRMQKGTRAKKHTKKEVSTKGQPVPHEAKRFFINTISHQIPYTAPAPSSSTPSLFVSVAFVQRAIFVQEPLRSHRRSLVQCCGAQGA